MAIVVQDQTDREWQRSKHESSFIIRPLVPQHILDGVRKALSRQCI